jgi:hypothetical protein
MKRAKEKQKLMKRINTNAESMNRAQSVVPNDINSIRTKGLSPRNTDSPDIPCPPSGVNIPVARFYSKPNTLPLNAT